VEPPSSPSLQSSVLARDVRSRLLTCSSCTQVLLAAACVLATVSVGVDASSALTFSGAASALKPTTFKVIIDDETDLGADGSGTAVTALAVSDRLEIHLPGFGGAYNSFGARHEDAAAPVGDYQTQFNGIQGLSLTGVFIPAAFSSAEWDAAREVLKLTVLDPNVRGFVVDSNYLRLSYKLANPASGLGPLPPNGGIDKNWYQPPKSEGNTPAVQVPTPSTKNPAPGTRWRGCAGTHTTPASGSAPAAATSPSGSVSAQTPRHTCVRVRAHMLHLSHWVGRWRRPWLVDNRATLPQKSPPPPRNGPACGRFV